jgi:hypothetical protein
MNAKTNLNTHKLCWIKTDGTTTVTVKGNRRTKLIAGELEQHISRAPKFAGSHCIMSQQSLIRCNKNLSQYIHNCVHK